MTDDSEGAHKLLLTDRKVSKFCKDFSNVSSANIKLSKTQVSKTVQSGGFFDRLQRPIMKVDLPVMNNVFKDAI